MQKQSSEDFFLSNALARIDLAGLAKRSGWLNCNDGKFTPFAFCLAMMTATNVSTASLRLVAFISGVISSMTVSKQALHKRINARALDFLEEALAAEIAASGRNGRSCRTARAHASLRQRIAVRSVNFPAVAADVAEAEVVGQDESNVGSLRRVKRYRRIPGGCGLHCQHGEKDQTRNDSHSSFHKVSAPQPPWPPEPGIPA